MLRFKEFLEESLDSGEPSTWHKEHDASIGTWHHSEAKHPDGTTVTTHFTPEYNYTHQKMGRKNHWDMTFHVNHHIRPEGTHQKPHRVMATVMRAAGDFHEKHKPEGIHFTSDDRKTGEFGDRVPNRTPLYHALVKKHAEKHGFKVETKKVSHEFDGEKIEHTEFHLTKKQGGEK